MTFFPKLRAKLLDIFHPFSQIAAELRSLRELYELELSERKPPIIRQTVAPSRSDTSVTFTGDEETKKKKSALERAKEILGAGIVDEDEEDEDTTWN